MREETAYNVSNLSPKTRVGQGNSATQAFNRLRSAAATDPDKAALYQQVLEKKLSPNKAMELAGFRPKRKAVNLENTTSAFLTLKEHMDMERLKELAGMLSRYVETGEIPDEN